MKRKTMLLLEKYITIFVAIALCVGAFCFVAGYLTGGLAEGSKSFDEFKFVDMQDLVIDSDPMFLTENFLVDKFDTFEGLTFRFFENNMLVLDNVIILRDLDKFFC